MVLGIRNSRNTDSFFKRFTAILFYRFLILIGIKTVYNHGDFRLLDKSLVKDLSNYPERNIYLRGLILKLESKYSSVYYNRRARKAGKTKFNLIHLISLALDGITSFSVIPIRLIFFLGLIMFVVSVFGFLYALYVRYVLGVDVPGWTSTVIVIVFFGGIQNLSLGVIGEYLSKVYLESKQRPIYRVRKIYD